MSRLAAPRLAWSIWALTILLLLGGLVTLLFVGLPADEVVFVFLFPIFMLAYATVGALIASREPRNAIGWMFLATGLVWSVSLASSSVAQVAHQGVIPVTGWVLFLDWLAGWIFLPALFAPLTFLLLLFPDGHLLSRRWRPVSWLAGIGILLSTLANAFGPGPLEDSVILRSNPYGLGPSGLWEAIELAGWPFGLAVMLLSASSLILRFRRSAGERRQQMKWLVFGAVAAVSIFAVASVGWGLLGDDPVFSQIILPGVTLFGSLMIPVSAGVAMLRHRLYDIDVVINKTLVYGLLVAFITALYLLVVVVLVGFVFGLRLGAALLPSLIAVVVLALLIQPLRLRAQRLANRLVYGKRASPYEVLADFSGRVGHGYELEDVLPEMARVLGEGTGARLAQVWLRFGEEIRLATTWPATDAGDRSALPLRDGGIPELPGASRSEPVVHRGELLGALAIDKAPGDPLKPAEEKLLADLASQAGLVLRNVRLTAELEERLRQLQESRKRLVTAQDTERRRIERNIHDGAQQQLVALAVKLRLVETLAARDPEKAAALAGQAKAELQEALDDLRELARGIYPPLLADKGLPAALEAQARKSPVPVEVDPDGLGRYPADAEAAVYFCVLEALQNAAKYSRASRVEVRLVIADGELRFEVADDGEGFDPHATPSGAGLQNMRDRLEALGGAFTISSAPGAGTRVVGRVRVEERETGP